MLVRLKIMEAIKLIAEEQKVTLPPLDDHLSLNETRLGLTCLRHPGRSA